MTKLRSLILVVLAFACCIAIASSCVGQSAHRPTPSEKQSVERFLRGYLNAHGGSTQYAAAFVDLRGNGTHDVIVQLTDMEWCGTGGCRTFILAPEGSSYRVVNNFLIAWPPIRVLTTKSHGWHDVGIWVQGGGIQPGYEARLSFNGKLYPVSAGLLRKGKLTEKIPGFVAVSRHQKSTPLFQQ